MPASSRKAGPKAPGSMPASSRKAGPKPPSYRVDVAELLSRLLADIPDVSERRASGGRPQFYAGSKLFAFLQRDGVVVKLPQDVVDGLAGRAGYEPYQMQGKPVMKEWLVIAHPDAAAYSDELALFTRSAAFVASGQRRRRHGA
jgi:hypothetical protein